MPTQEPAPARASSLWDETPIAWIGSRPIEQRGDGVLEDVFEARPPLLPPDALERTDDARRDYTPPRSLLTARAHKDFSDRPREQFNGKGSSQRAFSLVEKLREVEAVMTTALQTRVREYHPELVWQRLAVREHPGAPEARSASREERSGAATSRRETGRHETGPAGSSQKGCAAMSGGSFRCLFHRRFGTG